VRQFAFGRTEASYRHALRKKRDDVPEKDGSAMRPWTHDVRNVSKMAFCTRAAERSAPALKIEQRTPEPG